MKILSSMEKLRSKWAENKQVCVGLDTDPGEISQEVVRSLRSKHHLPLTYSISNGLLMSAFNKEIIRETCDLVCAYKFNLKFYLAELHRGLWALQESIAFAKEAASNIMIILDSKDGDVGVSMKKAAEFAFDKLGVDAVTVNPWGGYEDGLDAFFDYKDKMIFVWCRGSNKGSSEFQDIELSSITPGALYDKPFYELVAERISGFNESSGSVLRDRWNKFLNCGVVVGATHPEQLNRVRVVVGDMPILVPGIGAQKGDLERAVKSAMYMNPQTGQKSLPALFNSSRGIIYKSKGVDFAEAARKEVIRLQKVIVGKEK